MGHFRELRALRRAPDIVVSSLTINVLGLVLPLVMIQLYDRVIPNAGYETLIVLGVGLAVAILFDAMLRMARGWILSRAGARFELLAYSRSLRNLLHNPTTRADAPPGVLFNEVNQIDRIRMFHTGDTGMALLDLPFVFVFLGVMLAISPILGATVLAVVATVFVLIRMVRHRINHLSKTRLEQDGRRQSFLIETLGGVEVVKALGAEDFMERRYERLMTGSASVSARLAARVQSAQAIAGTAGLLAPVVTAGVGALLVIDEQLTVGALAASVLLTGRIVQPAMRTEMLLAGEEDVRGYESTVDSLLGDAEPDEAGPELPGVDRLVIHDLPSNATADGDVRGELTLTRGDRLLIVGAEQRETTAVAEALAGQGSLKRGRVALGAVPIGDYRLSQIRRRVSLISGKYRPLTGTILENMTQFQPDLHRERALELCVALGIDKFIARHPEGLSHQLMGEAAGELPAAIADGIGIVSALVADPDVLIFDDTATSFDRTARAALLAYLAETAEMRITVIISHQLECAPWANKQARIHDGGLTSPDVRTVLDLRAFQESER